MLPLEISVIDLFYQHGCSYQLAITQHGGSLNLVTAGLHPGVSDSVACGGIWVRDASSTALWGSPPWLSDCGAFCPSWIRYWPCLLSFDILFIMGFFFAMNFELLKHCIFWYLSWLLNFGVKFFTQGKNVPSLNLVPALMGNYIISKVKAALKTSKISSYLIMFSPHTSSQSNYSLLDKTV